MLDDFFIRALIAGLGVSLITGPMGCFTIWRRLSFFGDTLAHSALQGVTMALTFELNIPLAVFVISSIIAVMLLSLQKNTRLPGDALLGLLAHSSLAIGLVVIGFLSNIRFDVMGLLFGDILAVNKPDSANIIFTILMAAMIAIAIKMVGLLLITGMLIMPAAMARNLSDNPAKMVILSIVGGIMSVSIGLFASLEFNSPSGPSIITAALILFLLSLINFRKSNKVKNY